MLSGSITVTPSFISVQNHPGVPVIRLISRGASSRAHRGLCHRDRSLRLAGTSLTLALHFASYVCFNLNEACAGRQAGIAMKPESLQSSAPRKKRQHCGSVFTAFYI